jgi:hypothetical protein
VQLLAQLVGLDVLALGAAAAGDDRAGGGDARDPGQAHVLPRDPHPLVGYGRWWNSTKP